MNYARNALVRSLAPWCTSGSGPQNAVDGAWSNIYTDKWCSPAITPRLQITLPPSAWSATINRIVVKHAGAGGECTALNTKHFRIDAYLLINTFTHYAPIANVMGNTASVTTHPVSLALLLLVRCGTGDSHCADLDSSRASALPAAPTSSRSARTAC